jgi:hypothetical protein
LVLVRVVETVVFGSSQSRPILLSKPLVCGLVAAVVDALVPQVDRGPEHVEEAYNHVESADDVVNHLVVAVDAQTSVNTGLAYRLLAVLDGVGAH